MPYSVSFTDAARNFSRVTKQVAEQNVEVTIFKNNKPFVKIVPVSVDPVEEKRSAAIHEIGQEYWDLLEKMAHE